MSVDELKKNFTDAPDSVRKGKAWDDILQEAVKKEDINSMRWCFDNFPDSVRKGKAWDALQQYSTKDTNEKNKTNMELQVQRSLGPRPDAIRVFISSTYQDLKEERNYLKEKLENDLKYNVYLFESGGSKEIAREGILKEVEISNIFICLIANKYGNEINGGKISATEDEYNHAKKNGKQIFVYVKDIRGQEREEKLKAWLKRIGHYEKGHLYQEFNTKEQLIEHVKNDAAVLFAKLVRQEK